MSTGSLVLYQGVPWRSSTARRIREDCWSILWVSSEPVTRWEPYQRVQGKDAVFAPKENRSSFCRIVRRFVENNRQRDLSPKVFLKIVRKAAEIISMRIQLRISE